jgi:hypothetical protein
VSNRLKIKDLSPNIRVGFVDSLAQAISITGTGPRHKFPPMRTPSEALKGDWDKLGGDMRRAVDKVVPRGKR